MIGAAYSDADIARASLAQMNEISRRAEVAGLTFGGALNSTNTNSNTNTNTANNTAANNASGSGSNGAGSSSTAQQQNSSQPQQQQKQAGEQTQRPASSASRIFAAATAAGLMPERPLSRQDALARIEELSRARPTSAQGQRPPMGEASSSSGAGSSSQGGSSAYESAFANVLGSGIDERYGVPMNSSTLSHEGLQVFTVGHLMPKSSLDDENGNWSFDTNQLKDAVVMPTPQGMGCDPPMEGENERQQPLVLVDEQTNQPISQTIAPASAQKLRVRRSTYVPGWAVPPRVLLVDDDAISRRLSSKFLQVFGCSIDVAVDGVGAVNKMNLEKYDLVLMVRSVSLFVVACGCLLITAPLFFFLRCDVGHRHAQTGWYLGHVAHSPVRSYDAYHLYDEQLDTE